MTRNIRAKLLLLALLLPASGIELAARQQERPKIGLALSGGGARGLAHIGVLEWFEEHRIPVDFVAGSSMGGFVGGLYAMGMSPSEMRRLIAGLDWDTLLSGPPGYDELTFRRKEDRRAYPTALEFGLRRGLQLPRAINFGHYVGLELDRLTLAYSTVPNFDALPTPFRCVATDMIAAEPVVLRDGSLSQALRATIAIPGVLAPADVGGRVLADGGLLDNLPTGVVKDMGANVIIAVNVGTPLGTFEDLETLPGILAQVIGVTTVEKERASLKLADIVIAPDLGKYGRFDFDAALPMADLGYIGTASKRAELERLALADTAWQAHLAARRAKQRTGAEAPAGIDVTGVSDARAAEIRRKLIAHIGQPVRPDRLERQLSKIRGGGRDESIGYGIAQLSGEPRLGIRVREKTYGPPFITPVFQIQSRGVADVSFSGGMRWTAFDLGARNAEVRADAIFGSNNLVGLEYYRPLGLGGPFIAPRLFYTSDRTNLYRDGTREGQYLAHREGAAMDIGYALGQNSQLRGGYEIGRLDAATDLGVPLLPEVGGRFSAASARFVYDSQDSAVAPTRGVRATSKLAWHFKSPGAPAAFPQAELSVSAVQSVGKQRVLFGHVSGGTTFNREPGPVEQFTLGGPLRLTAYGIGEFRGSHYGLFSAGYRYPLGSFPTFLGGKIYAAAWYEGGSVFFRRSEAKYRSDGAAALVLETPLGPLAFGGAWGSSRPKFFFTFGRFFWGQHVTGSELEASYP